MYRAKNILPGIESLIKQCLDDDPNNRPKAEDLVEELKKIGNLEGITI